MNSINPGLTMKLLPLSSLCFYAQLLTAQPFSAVISDIAYVCDALLYVGAVISHSSDLEIAALSSQQSENRNIYAFQ
jgi:hypothetical protein